MGRGLLAVAKALQTCQASLNATAAPQRSAKGYWLPASRGWTITSAVGQVGADRVMVGDDQLEAELARQIGLGHGRDAAIDRDDQLGPVLGRQPPERLGIDPVALVDPVGDVVVDVLRPGQAEAGPEDARAADAVDVVIAIDDDLPALADRRGRSGRPRRRRRGGISGSCRLAQLRLEERPGRVGVFDPPVQEELRQQRRHARLPAQRRDPRRIVRPQVASARSSRRPVGSSSTRLGSRRSISHRRTPDPIVPDLKTSRGGCPDAT